MPIYSTAAVALKITRGKNSGKLKDTVDQEEMRQKRIKAVGGTREEVNPSESVVSNVADSLVISVALRRSRDDASDEFKQTTEVWKNGKKISSKKGSKMLKQ